MINPSNALRINAALVRGAYLNNFEGQNYLFKNTSVLLTGISSLLPIHKTFPFNVIRLPSVADIPFFQREIRFVSNRIIGDSQILFGLEKYSSLFDIFHTADPHYYYSYQLAKLRNKNKIKKLIVTSWETIPFNNEIIPIKKKNKYFVLNNADHFLCYTERAKECLIREGVEISKISVINLGVDLSVFNKTSNKKNGYTTILFVGRLVEEKGIMDVYEVFKKLYMKNKNIRLRILGNGTLKHKLTKRIVSDNLNDFISIETSTYKQIPEVYKESDIFILPSKSTNKWEEQYGMVFVEAMASGLPIVTYDTGAIKEIVGESGIICKENDMQTLYRSLHALITDKNKRLKIGTMGRRRAEEKFDSRIAAKKILELYKSVFKQN